MESFELREPQSLSTTLSVVIPCYNEEETLPILRRRLVTALDNLGIRWEAVLVDDGSQDRTRALLEEFHQQDSRFRMIGLSRNFGHQAAVLAGLTAASGDVVAVMDADLQDPPEILAECLEKWKTGFHVVYAIRTKRKEGVLKRASYSAFYRLLRQLADVEIPLDSGDFCLMDRTVVDVLTQMPERNIFVRGMRAWAGFRQVGVPYERDSRAAGATKYPFKKLVRLALDGVFSFSTMPLRLATWSGLIVLGACFLGIIFVIVWKLTNIRVMGYTGSNIPGWSAGMVAVLFLGGVQLLILGILGEYVARIYDEVKRRPRWIVSEALGTASHDPQVREERTP